MDFWEVNLFNEFHFDSEAIPIHVVAVLADGKAAEFVHRDNRLLVALPRVLAKGQTMEIAVRNGRADELHAQRAH